MADEKEVQATEDEATQAGETDWEAKYKAMREHSREWERKAKANEGAARELEQLRESTMTEQEKAVRRAEKAEAELRKLKADAQRRVDADEVSAKTGIPARLLMHCSDRADMEAFAAEFEADTHVPAATPAPESRIVRPDGAKPSNRDLFAQLLGGSFN